MKTVLIISYSFLHRDPRVLRQIQALKSQYDFITIGYTPPFPDHTEIEHYLVKPGQKSTLPEKVKRLVQFMRKDYFSYYYRKALDFENILKNSVGPPDVIIANDWDGLYSAVLLKIAKKWQAKIYFDAHEYAPDEFSGLRWRLLIRPVIIYALKECRKYIDAMSTVCDGIARKYEKFFDFSSGSVSVITNAPAYQEILRPTVLHNDKIRLIHHGGATKERKLELMIKMMRYLDPMRYELTFMLVPSQKKYYDYLVNTARQFKNIHFIEPVETARIAETLNTYDIGVFIYKGYEFNKIHTLPNKLFEFIQARLAIVIGPSSVEMAKIVNRYHLGVCSGNFSPKALAKCIMTLSPNEIMNCKNNADKYARELSAENNLIKIKNIIDDLAG
ncbi:MAG: hypothetical protein LBG80_16365 [Bacteroidales bacterium]|jgi:glycosyltransferase involved in cell wall biosynthesis|nr:hypothetical protein [Bacteroidales bacterium]